MNHPVNVQVNIQKQKTSWDQAGETLGDLNHSIGRSLSPFSIRGGFSVSTSWMLFGLWMIVPDQPWLGIFWLLSLFVQFR